MRSVGQGASLRELAARLDDAVRQRLDKQAPQRAPVDFRLCRAARGRPGEQNGAMPVGDATRVLAGKRQRKEFVVQTRSLEPNCPLYS